MNPDGQQTETIDDAAARELLDVTADQLEKLITAGVVRVVCRPRGVRRFSRPVLEEMLKDGRYHAEKLLTLGRVYDPFAANADDDDDDDDLKRDGWQQSVPDPPGWSDPPQAA